MRKRSKETEPPADASIDSLEAIAPAPLAFFRTDAIHPDNVKLVDRQEQRWRLLTWSERIALRRHVGRLAHTLRKGRWNANHKRLNELYTEWLANPDDARRKAIIRERAAIIRALRPLRDAHARYTHYKGWLEYERKNRRELKEEAKRDRQIRRDMDREAKWIETIIVDVWRKTSGCHHITTDGKGNATTRTPAIERSGVALDAHWLWVSVSKKTLMGYRWTLPYGVTVGRLTDPEVVQNMRAALKRQVDIIWSQTGQLIIRVSRLDSPDALPKLVRWVEAMKLYPEAKRHRLPYTVGVSQNRKFEWFDFLSSPHILVGGKSQSGKSNLVNGIIASLVATRSPAELRLVLIDQKGGMEFTHWSELPHLLWEMAKSLEQVQPYLKRIVGIMRVRMELLEAVKAKDIGAYNQRIDEEHRLPRLLVIIDEMSTFVGLGAQTEEIHNLLSLIVAQGRAVGIHVIASTQYPEVKVVPGRIKSNMDMRISGAMPSISASSVILDNPEAARIPPVPGRMVVSHGLKTVEIQAPLISDGDIAQVVAAAKVDYPDVPNELLEASAQQSGAPMVWDEQRVMGVAIDLLDGRLSGQKMHKLLGTESPGERHLAKMCRRIIDDADQAANVTRASDGSQWTIKKVRKQYQLVAISQSDQSDNQTALESAAALSD
jgi:S-DNA-T family DNA segregation ATPase FtsK/SpoIIIE